MAFKMKGMNFGKGTGFDLPNKVNSGFKKSSKLEGMKMVKDPIKMVKDPMKMEKDPMKMKTKDPMKKEVKKKGRLRQFAEEVGGELKRVAKNFGSYKDPAQRRRELRAYMERERAKNRRKVTNFKDTEKNVAQNKAAGPKTKAQTKDEKRPPMAMKNKEAMKMKTKDAMKMKTKDAMKMKTKDAMKMKTKDAMKMKTKDAMKMKTKDPMKLNKGFDRLPKEVQAKILKNKKKK